MVLKLYSVCKCLCIVHGPCLGGCVSLGGVYTAMVVGARVHTFECA